MRILIYRTLYNWKFPVVTTRILFFFFRSQTIDRFRHTYDQPNTQNISNRVIEKRNEFE